MRQVTPEVTPDMILVTNIFRDQLDRFGELYSMARRLESAIEALPWRASAVLNGDDPLVASFAPARPGPPPVLRPPHRKRGLGGPRARGGHGPLRALPARPDVPPGLHVAPRGLRVPGLRKQAAGPGHRGHRDPSVPGRWQRRDRRDAGRDRAGARAAAGTAQRVQRRRRDRGGVRAGDAGARERAVRSGSPAPGVRPS